MTNNDVLRRLRYALNLSDVEAVRLFALKGVNLTEERARALVGREEDPAALACSDAQLAAFLDALVLDRRGPPKPGTPPPPRTELTNNEILKKVRIALKLKDTEMLAMCAAGGHTLSKTELAALFRRPDHKHFRPAGNQLLRKFLSGLTQHLRPQKPAGKG